jgi:hypothetical protein
MPLHFKIIDRVFSDTLRNTATAEIKDYQQRFSNVANFYELLFKDLIVEKCDSGEACQTARKFFGKDVAKLVAIDGTEYSRPLFDVIIFYAGAYSCEGEIDFSADRLPQVKYKDRFMEKGEDISSCVPRGFDTIILTSLLQVLPACVPLPFLVNPCGGPGQPLPVHGLQSPFGTQ